MEHCILNYTRETLGKLFEAGDGICEYHTPEKMEMIAYEARKYNYRSICTSSNYIKTYKKLLEGTDVKVIGMVAYPYGDMSIEAKKTEIDRVIEEGCDAIDVVVNMSYLLSNEFSRFHSEVTDLVGYIRKKKESIEIKVLVEVVLLNDEQLRFAVKTVEESGADFFKTQTGWFPVGLSLRQLEIMRETAGPDFKIKACGAITESIQGLSACLDAGADIIGGNGVRTIENLEFYQDHLRRQEKEV